MTTFTRPTNPTGYSDEDYNWISKVEWLARYGIPELKPAQRKVFAMMLDGYTYWMDGQTKKTTLRRGDEIVPVRAYLPSSFLENHAESKRRGPEDLYGKRKVYTTYAWRLNYDAIEASKH
jgi:hypothetical protein